MQDLSDTIPTRVGSPVSRTANNAFWRAVLKKEEGTIVSLNDGDMKTPFYCVHTLMGSVTEFLPLAKLLEPDIKFFGIRAPYEKHGKGFPESIESLGAFYADELVKHQPEGPFILGGVSAGGSAALETAWQLRERHGREIALFISFDGVLRNTGAGIGHRHPLYWSKLAMTLPPYAVYQLKRLTLPQLARTILKRATAIANGHAVARMVNPDRHTPDRQAFMSSFFDAAERYVPRQYPGRMLVYETTVGMGYTWLQVASVWGAIAPRSEVARIKGNHWNMIDEPQARTVRDKNNRTPFAKHLRQQVLLAFTSR